MRIQCLALFLLTTPVYGQVAPQAAHSLPEGRIQNSATDTKAAAPVGPDDAVIVIDDFCPGTTQTGDACKTIVTRAQFDRLAEALQPGMPVPMRLKVAYTYARIIRMAAVAEQRGLDKTPAFEEEMRFARMQLLSQDLSRVLQEDAGNITDADIEDDYKKNQASYEQATFARIFVPHARRMPPTPEEHASLGPAAEQSLPPKIDTKAGSAQVPDEEAMRKLASDLRARAVNGEDPDKLQIDADKAAGMAGLYPRTRMEKVRRDTLPPSHEKVMDLQPGEVSAVIDDPGGGYFIYKMLARQTLALDDVKKEIRDQISTRRYKDSMKKFQGDAIFSDAYFNPPNERTQPHTPRGGQRTISPLPPTGVHNDTESPQ